MLIHTVGDLARIVELEGEVARLKKRLALVHETPAERTARILAAQAQWDADKVRLEDAHLQGFNRGYAMPPRPVL